MLFDKDRVQRGVEVALVAEPCRLDRCDCVEDGAGTDRRPGLAERAGEVDDVFGECAAACVRGGRRGGQGARIRVWARADDDGSAPHMVTPYSGEPWLLWRSP